MGDFSVKSDSVDVEQIMRQIRARIREKRGADYTEAELQQLASVKLEKFLDPRGIRSDLVAQFRKHRVIGAAPPNYVFEDTTLYETHRGPLRTIRRLLRPVLKLFFNPDKISDALHIQAKVNTDYQQRLRQREEMDPLFYEVIHNLVVEVTRLGIENHNLKMRVESLSSRMDFDERRARSLESVVQYKQPQQQRPPRQQPLQQQQQAQPHQAPVAHAPQGDADDGDDETNDRGRPEGGQGGDSERRRRRRRRRRRPGQTLGDRQGTHDAPRGATETSAAEAGLGAVREEGSPAPGAPPAAAPDPVPSAPGLTPPSLPDDRGASNQ
jgi:hypothetical protein